MHWNRGMRENCMKNINQRVMTLNSTEREESNKIKGIHCAGMKHAKHQV